MTLSKGEYWRSAHIQGGPKSGPPSRIIINDIKTASEERFFINFEYDMSTGILYVCIQYFMFDIIYNL